MSDVNQPGESLFAGKNAELESLIERFEEAWLSETSPELAEFLPDLEKGSDPICRNGLEGASHKWGPTPAFQALAELVHIDLECRLKRGDAVRVEKYLEDYPELTSDPEIAMSLIATEYELRLRSESDLTVNEFRDRFPQFSDELAERLLSARNQSEFQTASNVAATEATIIYPDKSAAAARENREPGKPLDIKQLRDYRLIEKIGEGGMGTVYRAVHERLGKTVAVKVLSEYVLRDGQAAARFDREMLAVGKVNHPNIVGATDAGDANGKRLDTIEEWHVLGPESLDWHPEGQRLAVGGSPRIIDLADKEARQKISTEMRTGSKSTLSWSHDGSFLAVAGSDGQQIEIRDGSSYELLTRLSVQSHLRFPPRWSPTENKIAVVGYAEPKSIESLAVLVWAFDQNRKETLVRTVPASEIHGLRPGLVAWSDDGKSLAFERYPDHHVGVSVGVVGDGKPVFLPDDPESVHPANIRVAAWHQQQLVTAALDGLRIWNTEKKELTRHIAVAGPTIEQAGLSDDGEILAVYGYRWGRFIDLKSQRSPSESIGSRFVWLNQDRRLLSWTNDQIQLHSYDDGGTQVFKGQNISASSAVSVSQNSRRLAVLTDGKYRVWSEWKEGKPRYTDLAMDASMTGSSPAQWSAAGDLLATPLDGMIVIWNATTGEEEAKFETTGMYGFALSPDGQRVLVNLPDGRAKFHSREPSRPVPGHENPKKARVHWTSDGKYVFSAGTRGELLVFDAETQKKTGSFRIPQPTVSTTALEQLRFSQDRELLTIAGPGVVGFWKSRTGEPMGAVLTDGTTISPDGHYRASEDGKHLFVYVLETTDGRRLTLDPAEIRKRFGWKNLPAKVQFPSSGGH